MWYGLQSAMIKDDGSFKPAIMNVSANYYVAAQTTGTLVQCTLIIMT